MSRLLALLLTLLALAVPATAQDLNADFRRWLDQSLWPEASAAGVSRATFDAAFAGMAPDLTLPELNLGGGDGPAIDQSEFRSPALYFNESSIARLVADGRRHLSTWSQTLAAIEQRYGVSRGILVAIWGRESAYGAASIPHNAIVTLATHAFIGRRPAAFRAELIAALRILQRGDVAPSRMMSSWAGGLGQPQFLPSAFLQYAVDFDGDGRADIWDSVPDTLASIANYLARHGWDGTRGWGLEVSLPASVPCMLEGEHQPIPLATWQNLGVTPADGTAFTRPGNTLYHLVMPAGRLGPAFLVTPNFYVLKDYNQSDLYALFVGALADRMTLDDRPFRTAWRDIGHFSHADVQAMQRRLIGMGYDVGGADGLIGYRTRIAIGDWQTRSGLPVTCFPDAGLIAALR
ncbi:MAG: lytic murein transglycosylase [Bauldia sp.]|nr:lytic murein transglycosylase [Bauldia sp.]